MKYKNNIDKEICELYISGLSTVELAKQFGFKTPKSINDRLVKYSVPIRSISESKDLKRTYDTNYFKKINSLDKGYFLGLMLTDGYICKNNTVVGLDQVEEDCIKYLSQSIGQNYTSLSGGRKFISPLNGKEYVSSKRFRINLSCKKIAQDLNRLSVTPNKSLNLMGPGLTISEEKYIPQILRGVIDGDGWIRKDGLEFFICGKSKDFLIWCMEKLVDLGMKNLSIKLNNDMFFIRSGLRVNINILNDIIYNKPMGMMKKYNRVKQVKPSETIMEYPVMDNGIVQTATAEAG